jgi:hypothetical protein
VWFKKIQLLTLKSNRILQVAECTDESLDFAAWKRRRVEARFDGGEITSDAGVLLLQPGRSSASPKISPGERP